MKDFLLDKDGEYVPFVENVYCVMCWSGGKWQVDYEPLLLEVVNDKGQIYYKNKFSVHYNLESIFVKEIDAVRQAHALSCIQKDELVDHISNLDKRIVELMADEKVGN